MSNIPEIPEQEVLRHIIELADPWYGQDKWDLCTMCNKPGMSLLALVSII